MTVVRPLPAAPVAVLALVAVTQAQAQPKHLYLTYSAAPETSIDVNVVLANQRPQVDVHFDTQPRGGQPAAYAQHTAATYTQTMMELSDRRTMYVATLTGLQPGTTYYFVAGEATYGFSRERSFRTLPGGEAPLRFVNGGDMGVTGDVMPLLTLAGKRDPDFAVIGGDLAYVNGLLGGTGPATWDTWLSLWDEHMVTTALSLLDSGHLATHEAQVPWLRQAFAANADARYTFAAYHVPLYPAHRDYEGAGSQRGREHWLPVFDEFGLTVALEHHDHVFKRTKVLKGNQVAPQGTVYIGDGAFGRPARTVDPTPRWYTEKEVPVAHFWVVDVSRDGRRLAAIDQAGTTVDEFSLPGRRGLAGSQGPGD